MAANLTPQYEKAEAKYKAATTDEDRLAALQEMLAEIPKHKASEKMQAELKRKISVTRKAMASAPAAKGVVDHFHVPKGGAGQVVLLGAPNVGKSSLVAVTTNAPVKVAEYPYTTAIPAPGMWPYEDVQIQLVDTPPMTADAVPSGLMGTVRQSDAIGIIVDASTDPMEQAEMMMGILQERGLKLRSLPRNEMLEDLTQYPTLLIVNKVDLAPAENLEILRELFGEKLEILPISTASGEGLDALAKRLWQLLAVIRIYTKEPGKPCDKEKPYILPIGSTLEDLAREIHRDLPDVMKFARIWGDGRFDGARVPREEELHDKDIVEIHSDKIVK